MIYKNEEKGKKVILQDCRGVLFSIEQIEPFRNCNRRRMIFKKIDDGSEMKLEKEEAEEIVEILCNYFELTYGIELNSCPYCGQNLVKSNEQEPVIEEDLSKDSILHEIEEEE